MTSIPLSKIGKIQEKLERAKAKKDQLWLDAELDMTMAQRSALFARIDEESQAREKAKEAKSKDQAKAQGKKEPATKILKDYPNLSPSRNDDSVFLSDDLMPQSQEAAGMPPVGGTLPFMVERTSQVRPEQIGRGIRAPVRTTKQTVKPNMMTAGQQQGLIQDRAFNQAKLGIEERRLAQQEGQSKRELFVNTYQNMISEGYVDEAGPLTRALITGDLAVIANITKGNKPLSVRLNETNINLANSRAALVRAQTRQADVESLVAANAFFGQENGRKRWEVAGFDNPARFKLPGQDTNLDGMDLRQAIAATSNDILKDNGDIISGQEASAQWASLDALLNRGYVVAFETEGGGPLSSWFNDSKTFSMPAGSYYQLMDQYFLQDDISAGEQLVKSGLFGWKEIEGPDGKIIKGLSPIGLIDPDAPEANKATATAIKNIWQWERGIVAKTGRKPERPISEPLPEAPTESPAVRAKTGEPEEDLTKVSALDLQRQMTDLRRTYYTTDSPTEKEKVRKLMVAREKELRNRVMQPFADVWSNVKAKQEQKEAARQERVQRMLGR